MEQSSTLTGDETGREAGKCRALEAMSQLSLDGDQVILQSLPSTCQLGNITAVDFALGWLSYAPFPN